MPRKYKTKEGSKKRKPIDKQKLKDAVAAVLAGGTLKGTSKQYAVPLMTLKRYARRQKEEEGEIDYEPNYRKSQIFSDKEEKDLVKYLEIASKLHHGLTPKNVRTLAYQFAKRNDKKVPDNWESKQEASYDWFWRFMNHHKELSLRKPEATSLSRATSFNRHNVESFFANLRSLMQRFEFDPQNIYNVDETGITTVHKPKKIVACRGLKQVSKVTSAERGELVTVCSAINAVGNHLPPFMVFPRKNWQARMLDNAPPGTRGAPNPSGWMSAATFMEFLKHFHNHVRPSKEKPCLIIFDNHESHISVDSVQFAKDHGIHLLTIPPHTSHKLQPLDRALFGSFKSHYDTACDDWMATHPARPITIYDISGLIGRAYPLAMTPRNITKSFQITGIYPLNSDVFTDDEFLSSYVTDRPEIDRLEEPLTDAEDVAVDMQQLCSRQREHSVNAPCTITSECSLERESSPVIPICDIASELVLASSLDVPSAIVSERLPADESSLMSMTGVTVKLPTLLEQSFLAVNKFMSSIDFPNVPSNKLSQIVKTSVLQTQLSQLSSSNSTTRPTSGLCFTPAHEGSIDRSTINNSIGNCTVRVNEPANYYVAPTSVITAAMTSNDFLGIASKKPDSAYLSPDMIRPYPKAGPRKTTKKGRKKGATKILTDTPEKEALEKEYNEREEKKKKQEANKIKRNLNKEKTTKMPKAKKQKRNTDETSSDEENFTIPTSPGSDDYTLEDDEEKNSESEEEEDDGYDDNIHQGDWVVVNLTSERNLVHRYVGQIIKEHVATLDVKFAKKINDKKFKWPEKNDISLIGKYQVVKKLPAPQFKSSSRRVGSFEFPKSLRCFNIKK